VDIQNRRLNVTTHKKNSGRRGQLKCNGTRAEIKFLFRRNGRIHLKKRGCQFSRLQAAEVCASPVVMLDTSCCEVVWRVLVTHSIRQFPLHFPSSASPCAITFQLESTCRYFMQSLVTSIVAYIT